ncbi:C2 domain protein [Ichthyophthirius multifiliis]|uniref:C2 domain protein n=1 Tax=Ichthyophthirius multifiliis TaxID=5932 RepID=G0R5B8_ICHMU|nr:C2 domain protein [Ichthyophthirius multifiliis]EGR27331.1 C2 domain protein [Ichthyophthirius multifiliis]|eukprot:XP_004024215.1 C2 domain protein [Ichthyophthirius multifiliis]
MGFILLFCFKYKLAFNFFLQIYPNISQKYQEFINFRKILKEEFPYTYQSIIFFSLKKQKIKKYIQFFFKKNKKLLIYQYIFKKNSKKLNILKKQNKQINNLNKKKIIRKINKYIKCKNNPVSMTKKQLKKTSCTQQNNSNKKASNHYLSKILPLQQSIRTFLVYFNNKQVQIGVKSFKQRPQSVQIMQNLTFNGLLVNLLKMNILSQYFLIQRGMIWTKLSIFQIKFLKILIFQKQPIFHKNRLCIFPLKILKIPQFSSFLFSKDSMQMQEIEHQKLLYITHAYMEIYNFVNSQFKMEQKQIVRILKGKNPLHFAASGTSIEVVKYILNINSSLVHFGDNNGLYPLHYSVFNTSQAQIEIIRLIVLIGKADINGIDENGKTALHHAAKEGKGKIIPILIELGSDITLKEKTGKKTALELACNDRIREMIIIYTGEQKTKGQKHNIENNSFLQIQQCKIQFQQQEEQEKIQIKIHKNNENINCNIQEHLRQRFYFFMKNIQQEGIKSWHHLKKPYIYTASWFEGIKSCEELYDVIKKISPCEATIRVFNILCPYEDQMPISDGKENIIDNFYGYQWSEKQDEEIKSFLNNENNEVFNNKIKTLKEILQLRENEIVQLEEKNQILNEQIVFMENQIQENEKGYTQMQEEMKKQQVQKDEKIKKLNENINQKTKQNQILEKQIKDLQNDIFYIQNKQTSEEIRTQNLQEQIQKLQQENENLNKKLSQKNNNTEQFSQESIKNDDESVKITYQIHIYMYIYIDNLFILKIKKQSTWFNIKDVKSRFRQRWLIKLN